MKELRRTHQVELRSTALDLRSQGKTLHDVGYEMGFSGQHAANLINAGATDPEAYALFVMRATDWSHLNGVSK